MTVAVVDTGVDYDAPRPRREHLDQPGRPAERPRRRRQRLRRRRPRRRLLRHDDSNPTTTPATARTSPGIIGAQGNNAHRRRGRQLGRQADGAQVPRRQRRAATRPTPPTRSTTPCSHGARVINASWGGPAFSQALYQAIKRAGDQGVLVVAAAGNDGVNADSAPDYPAALRPSERDLGRRLRPRRPAGSTSRTTAPHSVDLAAPGEDIYSTVPSDTDSSGYASFSGTSMAAPVRHRRGRPLPLAHPAGDRRRRCATAILQSVDQLPSLAGKTVDRRPAGRRPAARRRAPSAARPSTDRTAPRRLRACCARATATPAKHRALRFAWQRSRDASGIRATGSTWTAARSRRSSDKRRARRAATRRPKARLRLARGRHRWFVRAYDYAGNHRTSRSFRKAKCEEQRAVRRAGRSRAC